MGWTDTTLSKSDQTLIIELKVTKPSTSQYHLNQQNKVGAL